MSWSGLPLIGQRSVIGIMDLRTCSCLLDRTWLFTGEGEMHKHTNLYLCSFVLALLLQTGEKLAKISKPSLILETPLTSFEFLLCRYSI